MKNLLKMRFLSFVLALALMFTTVAPTKVYASELALGGYLVSTAGSTVVADGAAALAGLTAASGGTVAIVVGAGILGALACQGIYYAADDIAYTAKAIGHWVVNKYNELEESLQRHISGIAQTIALNPSYYDTNNTYLDSSIVSGMNTAVADAVDAGVITLNTGYVSQITIPYEIMESMTNDQRELVNSFPKAVITYSPNNTAIPYYVYEFPSTVTYALCSTDGSKVRFYDSTTNLVWSGDANSLYYNAYKGEWVTGKHSTNALTAVTAKGYTVFDDDVFTYLGLELLVGTSLAGALGHTTDVDLGLDNTEEKDLPYVLNPTYVNYQDLLGVSSKDKAVEDVLDVTQSDVNTDVGTDTGIGILDWLKSAWKVFTDILDAIASIPAAVGTAIGNVLKGDLTIAEAFANAFGDVIKALFVPDELVLDEANAVLDEKFPIIEDLKQFGAEVNDIIENPENYSQTRKVGGMTFLVDFSRADTYWDYGDSSTNAFDFDWYYKYKATVDEIIVSIAWLVFLWNLYGQIPSIVGGFGTGVYLDRKNEYLARKSEERKNWRNKGGD